MVSFATSTGISLVSDSSPKCSVRASGASGRGGGIGVLRTAETGVRRAIVPVSGVREEGVPRTLLPALRARAGVTVPGAGACIGVVRGRAPEPPPPPLHVSACRRRSSATGKRRPQWLHGGTCRAV